MNQAHEKAMNKQIRTLKYLEIFQPATNINLFRADNSNSNNLFNSHTMRNYPRQRYKFPNNAGKRKTSFNTFSGSKLD